MAEDNNKKRFLDDELNEALGRIGRDMKLEDPKENMIRKKCKIKRSRRNSNWRKYRI